VIAVLLAVALSTLTYKFIEKPIRFGLRSIHIYYRNGALFLSMMMIVFFGCISYANNGLDMRQFAKNYQFIYQQLQWDKWLDLNCLNTYKQTPCLLSGSEPKVFIWGDSHANHLYPGLVKVSKEDILATGVCPPLLDIEMRVTKNQKSHFCISENFPRKNLNIIESNPNLKTIILASYWSPLLTGKIENANERASWGSYKLVSNIADEENLLSEDLVYRGLARLINAIPADRKILFVRDAPSLSVDIRGKCLQRLANDKKLWEECAISRSIYLKQRLKETELVEKLQRDFPRVLIIDPINQFCDENNCYLVKDGIVRLRDHHHLSKSGSELVSQEIILHLK
jgi:hypothetical protein